MNLTWLFVLVPYAIAVHLARIPKRIALLFYGLVLVFLWAPLTQDRVLLSADVIRLAQPWSEVRAPGRPPFTKYDVSNLNVHDVTMQVVPWMAQVRDSWHRGEVPLWNALAGSGMPLLANGQSTPLSPFRIATLPLPLAQAIAAEAAMKLLLALVLAFAFVRRRHSIEASVVAAIAYGFSTWMTTWLQFPIAAAAAFLPGVFLAIDLNAERWTRGRFLGAVAMFTLAVYSGHPETIYHIGLFAAAYGLWIAPRAAWRIAAASAVAVLLTLPFLVPFAQAVVESQRFAEVREVRAALEPPFSDFPSAILLLQPRFFGELPIERPWGPTTLESICGFAGVFAIVAAIAVAFDVVQRRRWREREMFFAAGFVVCIGIVLGWPGLTEGFSWIAAHAPPMRMRLGICWFGALLAASAIDRARETPLPLLAGALAVAASILFLLRAFSFPSDAHRITALLAFLPSLAVLASLLLLRVRGAVMLLAALTFVELFVTMRRWNTTALPREVFPSTPLIAAIPRDGRIAGLGGQLYPNANAMFGLADVRVHDPMAWNPYVEFLARTAGWNPRDYYAKWNDAETPVLDFLNVRYVITEPARELAGPRYRLIYAGRDGRVYENTTALPRFFAVRHVLPGGDAATHTDWRYTALVSRLPKRWAAALTQPHSDDAKVEIVRNFDDAYRLRVHAARPTLVVSSVPDVPGWRVRGGEKVRVNHAFLGVIVDAGEHEIDLAYRPRSFTASVGIAMLTLLALGAWMWRAHSDRKAAVREMFRLKDEYPGNSNGQRWSRDELYVRR